MTKTDLIAPKYIQVYNKIRSLVNDEDVYPEKSDSELKEYMRSTDWLPAPSFGITPKESKKSDKAHISIRVDNDKVTADLFFNGKPMIERFLSILEPSSLNLRKAFFESIRDLGEDYVTLVQFTTKDILRPAKWDPIGTPLHCKGLTEKDIDGLLENIRATEERRDLEQQKWSNKKTVTLSVRLAKVETDINNDSKLKEVFTNLAKLIRITYNLKSANELIKIKDRIENQKQVIKEKEEHLNKIRPLSSSVKEFGEEKIKELEKDLEKEKDILKELEEGDTSEHERK